LFGGTQVPLLQFSAWLLLGAGLFPALYLGLLALAALFFRGARKPEGEPGHRIAILIPAHDEALLIADTVTDALRQDYPGDAMTVFVVADNCSDETARCARDAGARVLERHSDPGKGQALLAAFAVLMGEAWDAVVVVDADTRLHRGLLRSLARELAAGAEAIQVFYGVLNPGASRRTMAMELALASFNGLRPRGKAGLGLSAGLFGNGFCLARRTLEAVPYRAGSIVEDLEYHRLLLRAGRQVRYIDDVWVTAQMPVGAADGASQRVRWERGRLALVRALGGSLLADLLRLRPGAFQVLIDVCLPPVSAVCLFLMAAAALGDLRVRLIAGAAGMLLVVHYLLAAAFYGNFRRTLLVAAYIPYYLCWKTWTVGRALLTRSGRGWVRTKRH